MRTRLYIRPGVPFWNLLRTYTNVWRLNLVPNWLIISAQSWLVRWIRYFCRLEGRLRLKCDGTRAETRFRLSAKRTSPFKSARESAQSTTASRVVRISGSNGSNAGYTMFRGSVKGTGYPLHSPVSPSLPLPCVTVCHHVSSGLYKYRPTAVQNLPPS